MGDFFGKPKKSLRKFTDIPEPKKASSSRRDCGFKCHCGHPVAAGGVCARCGSLNMEDTSESFGVDKPYTEKMSWALQNGFFGESE